MVIHVKPDKNHRPTYIPEGGYKKSIFRQILTGIAIAFKIFFFLTATLIIFFIMRKYGIKPQIF